MDGATGAVKLTYKRCPDPNNCPPPEIRRPVLIVPGILGSYYYATADHQYWVLNRGVRPARVVIDPLTHAYDDLIRTLKNVGYVEGKDLFIAAYDWRLTPGPVDGKFDGRLAGLTGASITDTTYEYGVDYLGFWLRQAAEAWQRDHPGKTLGSVDVITHSTGGLMARSYIQSDAYGDTFVSQGQSRGKRGRGCASYRGGDGTRRAAPGPGAAAAARSDCRDLRLPADQLDGAVWNPYADLQTSQKEIARLRVELALQQTDGLAANVESVNGVAVVAASGG